MDPYDPSERGTGAINDGEPQHVILSGREYEKYLRGALNELNQDDKEQTVREFLAWLNERGLSICNVSNAIFWPVETAEMAERFAGKPRSWVKPEGCVCGGPSDPYHGWCDACAKQSASLT